MNPEIYLERSPLSPSVPSDVAEPPPLLPLEAVQKHLRRSRASVYRYANTDAEILNPPFDPQRLNPEVRSNKDDPLLFHPSEVRRFARDVLGLNPTIEVQTPPETVTQELLREILGELREIRGLIQAQSQRPT